MDEGLTVDILVEMKRAWMQRYPTTVLYVSLNDFKVLTTQFGARVQFDAERDNHAWFDVVEVWASPWIPDGKAMKWNKQQ